MLQQKEIDKEKVYDVLDKLNLLDFNERMVRLSKACFEDDHMDEQIEFLIQHACRYGIFGTEKSYKSARVVARGPIEKGKAAALKDALFMPYEKKKVLYPALENQPYLLPYYWSKRLIGKSHRMRSNIRKMDYSVVSEESYEEIQRFFLAGGYKA